MARVYDMALADSGMTTAQFAILRHVARAGEMPLSRLADALVMDRTSLYRAVTPIEAKGWLAVTPGPGRSRVARLTEAGNSALAGAHAGWEAAQRKIIGAMGEEMWMGLEFALQAVTTLAVRAEAQQ